MPLEEFYGFDPNDRQLIEAALRDTDPNNPVAVQVAKRLDALRDVLSHVLAKQGALPQEITVSRPSTVLDEIVIDMFRRLLVGEGYDFIVRVL